MNRKGKYKIENKAKSVEKPRYFSIYDYDKLDNVYLFRFSKRRNSIEEVAEKPLRSR